jgi:hypothetical protein
MDLIQCFQMIAPSKLRKVILEGIVKFIGENPEAHDDSHLWISCANLISVSRSNF